jgi:hypothetical protein
VTSTGRPGPRDQEAPTLDPRPYVIHRDIYDRPDGIDLVGRTEIMPLLEELHCGQGRPAIADKYELATPDQAAHKATDSSRPWSE